MAKEKFERNKPHVNIGTIGHVDHGALAPRRLETRGLLGVSACDRLLWGQGWRPALQQPVAELPPFWCV